MKIIYVAGPYTAPTPWGVSQNIEVARQVAAALYAEGWAVFCPHANRAHMDGVCSLDHFYQAGLAILAKCDAIVLLPGWQDSKGTRAELKAALEMGHTVYRAFNTHTFVSPWEFVCYDTPDMVATIRGRLTRAEEKAALCATSTC